MRPALPLRRPASVAAAYFAAFLPVFRLPAERDLSQILHPHLFCSSLILPSFHSIGNLKLWKSSLFFGGGTGCAGWIFTSRGALGLGQLGSGSLRLDSGRDFSHSLGIHSHSFPIFAPKMGEIPASSWVSAPIESQDSHPQQKTRSGYHYGFIIVICLIQLI